ncbi:MAG: hypothetical protein IJK84_01335 [Bacteroidales bacterium]|nr:hypothetical protein [Bacteroidales bacterium]
MEQKEQQKTNPTGQPSEEKKQHGWLAKIMGGDVLQSKAVVRQMPVVLLCCFYALLLVYNRYKVEDLTKAKLEAQERINFLRESRIELQKRYQETVKISQIAELLDSTGVGITAGPPFEI